MMAGLSETTRFLLGDAPMSELDNPTRAAVLAGLKKAALIDRYHARKDALELAIKWGADELDGFAPEPKVPPADTIISTAQKFYDFILDIAGPEQVAFGEALADE